MIFLLIKNELIKILKRTKTWIIFGLFLVFMGVCMYGLYNEDKNRQMYNSSEYKIEQFEKSIEYTKEEINKIENIKDKEYLNTLQEDLKHYEEEKVKYQNQIINPDNAEQWKLDVTEEIKNHEENLKDKDITEEDKTWISERINKLKYLEDNNIKPLYGYEFNAYNYIDTILAVLGVALLAIGISVFMSDIVSGESTPPTLKFLLVQPVSRGKVLLSKFIAVIITAITMIVSTEILTFLGIGLAKGFKSGGYPKTMGVKYFLDSSNISVQGYPDLIRLANTGKLGTFNELIIKSLLLQVLFIITCCSFVFLISTLFKNSNVTMAISIIIAAAGTIVFQIFDFSSKFAHLIFFSYASVSEVITGDIAYMYRNVNITPSNGIIVMIVTTIISYTIAHVVFKNKEILI
ncbi:MULTISPECIES: ABC transporter permease subunit [Clostridium]|uniref:ABC transporter permease subunit n=1 Tax=Clostridium TaxID=1485 RepID=UPI0003745B8D|nr:MULTISPECIES: ABC transporter permease subunit [Clostridium]MBN1036890.1 ABC transporter permease [Clostridium botulinum]MBY6811401.1 ABC transporter permease subunit [Clostridium botulinum]MBY6824848.1 ABC transporter permease subunit [Clostridium botulinum]MBY6835214.1 ABC transporter permease subunit [Clostridium botulinum]MBY6973727.1 ABC transporter permease subunit [Clostridium botulinum]